MKRTSLLITLFALLAMQYGCGSQQAGHIPPGYGQRSADSESKAPPGMVYIPAGSFTMGPSDADIAYGAANLHRTVSVSAFFMDEAEITNNQYRFFVEWVRDSILMDKLALDFEEYQVSLSDEEEDRLSSIGREHILNFTDRNRARMWQQIRRGEEEHVRALNELSIQDYQRYFRRRQLDTRLLRYAYNEIHLGQAARNPNLSYADMVTEYEVPVYPDTLVWVRDFTYSYNEQMAVNYFSHPGFSHYPVVGVNWSQARAFAHWRTELLNRYRQSNNQPDAPRFRLPTETEWEYAARGGSQNNPYPWGGPFIRDRSGCFMANFKAMRGNYVAAGNSLYTMEVGSFAPNDYGLFDMAGNVAEWTNSAYSESALAFVNEINPDFQYNARDDDPPIMRRKVIRGGSWKDVGYYLQVSTRAYEYQDSATSFIGFRLVQDYPGTGRPN